MKKSLLIGILSLGAMTMSSHGQGIIFLQNYTVSGPYVEFEAGVPFDGASGTNATPGTFIYPTSGIDTSATSGWTAGFYWAAGNVVAS